MKQHTKSFVKLMEINITEFQVTYLETMKRNLKITL